ncbi:MAG: Bax inhibitor-1/YccA family protein [Vampirovibrio sp.]|nr:Bax inhibitor-1/YccA family protein [Vampirovibrio sp.]
MAVVSRSGNPVMNDNTLRAIPRVVGVEAMTTGGSVNKTLILLGLSILTAAFTWNQFMAGAAFQPYLWGGAIGGLVIALVTVFKKEWSPITAPLYALVEGLVLGGMSAMFEASYPGIAFQAVALTFGVMFAMLFAYQQRWVQVTEKFRMGLIAATGGIMLVYVISMVIGFFGMEIPFIFGSGPIGIGFSLLVVGIAAFNLVLDFDFIEKGANAQLPKYMEWYAAFGLMVTLIWLYLEILRLLAKLRGGDRR